MELTHGEGVAAQHGLKTLIDHTGKCLEVHQWPSILLFFLLLLLLLLLLVLVVLCFLPNGAASGSVRLFLGCGQGALRQANLR